MSRRSMAAPARRCTHGEPLPKARGVSQAYDAKLPTAFAVLGIRTARGFLREIVYLPRGASTLDPVNPLATEVCRQLERYLDDADFKFTVPFEFRGTPFQERVWREICAIPRGRTRTYMDVARRLASAPRPVGGACGANHIPLVIPCHRVVASGGIGGFMNARRGDPITIKTWLLQHESR